MNNSTLYRARDYNRRIGGLEFEYDKDANGILFLKNPPSDLAPYYTNDYHFVPSHIQDYERHVHQEAYKLELINRFKVSGCVLEIGPSIGMFLYAAKKAGFEVSAIEMSPECCRVMRDIVGVDVHLSEDAAAELGRMGQQFDVIAMWHSLEHMRNWPDVFGAAAASLAPGGLLAIAMPNPHALQFRIMGKWWTHLDAPRHLFLIPAQHMADLGRAAGLLVELITTKDRGSVDWNLFGWERSFHNFGSNRYSRYLLRKLGSVAEFLLRPFERREGQGSAYTIIFRKPV